MFDPLFLTDEEMGIDKYSESLGGDCLLDRFTRADYGDKFRKELAKGVVGICIHMYGKKNNSNHPDYIMSGKFRHCMTIHM